MIMMTQSQKEFMAWLKGYDKGLYEVAALKLQNSGGTLAGYELPVTPVNAPSSPPATSGEPSLFERMTTSLSNGIATISKTISTVLPEYNNYRINKALVNAQIKRANLGIPLLQTGETANPRELSESEKALVRNAAAKSGNATVKSPVVVGVEKALPLGLLALGVWAITKKKRGGRR